MSLSLASMIASDSLGSISTQTNLVSRNISGANTPGYSLKIARLVTQIGGSSGVSGVDRASNLALFRTILSANAGYGAWSTIDDGLTSIERSLNVASDSSASTSPAVGLSKLRDALQNYSSSPTDATAANNALSRASELVNYLNSATTTVQNVREEADASISASVTNIRDLLSKFETINKNIIAGTAAGADVTDDMDARDQILSELSSEMGIKTVQRQSNDMIIYTDSGVTLFETTPREITFQANQPYTAAVNGGAVLVDGVPIAGDGDPRLNIQTGRLIGLTRVRDDLAPKMQAQLDETARGIIIAFSESDQGGTGKPDLPGLFTYAGATSLPGTLRITGLAGEIIVNPNVDPAQGGNLTRLRDGGISAPADPAYIYNRTGASGFSSRLIELTDRMGQNQVFDAAAGLRSETSLMSFATDSVGWLSSQRQQSDAKRSYQSALVSQTGQALSNTTGVNIDDQMSRLLALENSYQASAKLLAAINDMYSALFSAIRA